MSGNVLGRGAKCLLAALLVCGAIQVGANGSAESLSGINVNQDLGSAEIEKRSATDDAAASEDLQLESGRLPAVEGVPPLARARNNNKTIQQALIWANNQKGRALDVDGFYGAQCVDLTMAYSEFLFGRRTFGNAVDYTRRDFSGFTRLSKSQTKPKPGDIAVWTGGAENYGHVGIVIAVSGESFTSLEQNVAGNPKVQQMSRHTGSMADIAFWGVQRPALLPDSSIPAVAGAVYRLYNSQNGDHFFTANHYEAESLRTAGLQYEGVGFFSANNGTPIFRCYNPKSGEHLYSANVAERYHLIRLGWKDEGVGWFAPNGGINVYRVMNPKGFHLWTTNLSEVNRLISAGWIKEGVAFKG
ncbi:MAG: CHAP domain-containing protein [Streptococcaceae bacterium]|jgi:hypothetical protein|nr:CHAP domain-containing protein [Streptococcaceae bacterium]